VAGIKQKLECQASRPRRKLRPPIPPTDQVAAGIELEVAIDSDAPAGDVVRPLARLLVEMAAREKREVRK
jgi:hypothetical protein